MTDELAGTWVFNDTIDTSQFFSTPDGSMYYCYEQDSIPTPSILVNFNSNNMNFIGIGFDDAGIVMVRAKDAYYGEDNPFMGTSKGWQSDAFKTITITSKLSEVTNGDQLLTWLQANATKQETPTVHKVSVDLTTLPGWSSLSSGSHSITIVAKAENYRDSEPSAAVSVEKAAIPVKGDLITIEGKQYRVLKTNDNVAEVLCMYDASTSQKFDRAGSGYNNTYAGKNIDTYCNNTFYSGLSAAMKTAIVDKTFTQDSWKWTSSVPTGSHYTGKNSSSNYYLTLANAAYGTSITKHCYCLSVQDVLDYLDATTSMGTSDTTLTDTNIWQMFWNTTSQSSKYIWLRSAYSSNSGMAFSVRGDNGGLINDFVDFSRAVRPAFRIDLSKVEWTK